MSDKLHFVAFVDVAFDCPRQTEVRGTSILSIKDEPTIKQPSNRLINFIDSSVRLVNRKRNCERAARPWFAIEFNRAVVRFRHPFSYGKTESASSIGSRTSSAGSVESLEDASCSVRGDANAGIRHSNLDAGVFTGEPDQNVTARRPFLYFLLQPVSDH